MKKFCMVLVTIFLFLASDCVYAIDTEENSTLAANATSAILIEASTGEILFEKNSHEKLAPASMTKMMSMLLVLEAIEDNVIAWDEVLTISKNASDMGGSQILLETGEEMTVHDLFKGVAVGSANDAIVALAEAVGGSEEEFVSMMNKKARELSLNDTNFKNPHGLDEVNHYSSAHDMAIIAKELVKHDKVLEFSSIYEDYLRKGTTREFWLVNTNKLVKFNPIVDGLKTGYTKDAGYCLTATSFKNDMRLIAVVMKEMDSATRNKEVTELLDYGYAKYKIEKVVDKNDIIKTITLDKASDENISIKAKEDINKLLKKSTKLGDIKYEINMDEIKLPLNEQDKVGTLKIIEDNKVIGNIELIVDENIKRANIFKLYFRTLRDIIKG